MVHVQAKMVNRELHRISRVPRASGADTYLTDEVGNEHVVSNVAQGSADASNQKRLN